MEKITYTVDDFSINEAFEVADIVVIGQISQPGDEIPMGGGQIYYQGTSISVQKIEKGNLSESSILVHYKILSIDNGKPVSKPEQGTPYRFYIFIQRDRNNELWAFKITDV